MKPQSNLPFLPGAYPLVKRILLVTPALLTVSPFPCLGANQSAIDAGSYFRMIWGLLVVLGVILLLYGLLRKRFSILSSPEGKLIKVTETKPLGARKMLCLVEVRGEEFLLGISGDNITHLATLDKNKKSGKFAKELQSAQDEAVS